MGLLKIGCNTKIVSIIYVVNFKQAVFFKSQVNFATTDRVKYSLNEAWISAAEQLQQLILKKGVSDQKGRLNHKRYCILVLGSFACLWKKK